MDKNDNTYLWLVGYVISQSLIDLVQFLHINNGAVELDPSIMGAQQEGKKMKVPLNSRYAM